MSKERLLKKQRDLTWSRWFREKFRSAINSHAVSALGVAGVVAWLDPTGVVWAGEAAFFMAKAVGISSVLHGLRGGANVALEAADMEDVKKLKKTNLKLAEANLKLLEEGVTAREEPEEE
jgi:hypothetical protein